ncbi:MAG: UDP-glucose 4-epimerase GalE [Firmicutes bacterium]|nr:UDP-glucose 4-epimerase GalE [Bacillota bacterium]
MTILVTGGAGYIGSHTCVSLLESRYTVVAMDDLSNSSEESLRRVGKITGKSMEFFKASVQDEDALSGIFDSHKIDCVIHFAGFKAVGESTQKPLEYYENNLASTIALAKAMSEHGCKRLIFSSSATVYDGRNIVAPFAESARTGNCTNPYGWTKFMNEQILRDWAASDPEVSVVNLRYFNPIGAHPSGLIGEDPRGIPNNLMPYISQVAVGRRDHLSVYGDDYDTKDGTGVRDYIHVMDLAEGHVKAVEYAMEHTGEAVFNLGTGTGYSVLEIVKAFEKASGVKIPYVITDRRPGDLAELYSDPSKSAEQLHWTAKRGLEEMCRDTWNWQKNNPNGYEGQRKDD